MANRLIADSVAQPVAHVPVERGGLSVSHIVSAASTNATVLKASKGQLYGLHVYNTNAAARKVAFHNAATTPTAGAAVFFSVVVPAESSVELNLPTGIAFSTGIAITMVTEAADSGSSAVGAADLIFNAYYA